MNLEEFGVKQSGFFSINQVYKAVVFTIIYILSYCLFRHQYHPYSDIYVHINMIPQIVHGDFKIPHAGFHYTVFFLAKLFHLPLSRAGLLVLTAFFTILAYIIFWLLKKFLIISTPIALFSTMALLLVSAIYVPFFNKSIYLGQGSPNVWHSPTLIAVKPLAFLVTYLSIRTLDYKKLNYWILLSGLLLLSTLYKPNFSMVFIPAFFIYIVVNYTKCFPIYIKAALVVFPTCLCFMYQYFLLKHMPSWNPQGTLIFSAFGVLHLYTPNVLISLLLAIAFPVALALFRFKQMISNRYLQLVLIMFVIAYLQMAFLAQSGPKFADGNLFWGYMIILSLLFVFCFIEYVKWIQDKIKLKDFSARLEIGFVSLIFALHLFSGIFYLYRIFSADII